MAAHNAHYICSKVTSCEKLDLRSYLWLQKVWILLQRSPAGISVWNPSPSLKAGQLVNPCASPLPRNLPMFSTLISLAILHVHKQHNSGHISLFILRGKRRHFFNILHSRWGWLSFASFLFLEQLRKLQCAALRLNSTDSLWLVIYTICQDWRCQTGDTSWVVSTCPRCCMAGSRPNGFVRGNRSRLFMSHSSDHSMQMITSVIRAFTYC